MVPTGPVNEAERITVSAPPRPSVQVSEEITSEAPPLLPTVRQSDTLSSDRPYLFTHPAHRRIIYCLAWVGAIVVGFIPAFAPSPPPSFVTDAKGNLVGFHTRTSPEPQIVLLSCSIVALGLIILITFAYAELGKPRTPRSLIRSQEAWLVGGFAVVGAFFCGGLVLVLGILFLAFLSRAFG